MVLLTVSRRVLLGLATVGFLAGFAATWIYSGMPTRNTLAISGEDQRGAHLNDRACVAIGEDSEIYFVSCGGVL